MVNQKDHVLFISLKRRSKGGQAGGNFFSSASVGRAHTLLLYSYALWEFPETLLFHHRTRRRVFGSLDNTKEEVGKEQRFRFAYIKNRLK